MLTSRKKEKRQKKNYLHNVFKDYKCLKEKKRKKDNKILKRQFFYFTGRTGYA